MCPTTIAATAATGEQAKDLGEAAGAAAAPQQAVAGAFDDKTLKRAVEESEEAAAARIVTAADERMHKATKLANPEKYFQEINALRKFLIETMPPPACGAWIIMDADGIPDPASMPIPFDNALLYKYAAWLLRTSNKYKKGNLSNARSATNFFYGRAKLGSPWQGSEFWRTMDGYTTARKAQAIEAGDHGAAGLRVAMRESTLVWCMDKAELYPDGNELKSAFTLILLGWVCLLRASSASFQVGDIELITNHAGQVISMLITSTVLKMEDGNPSEKKQLTLPAAPLGAPADHPRKRLFALVEIMLKCGNLALCGAPSEANTVITGWMRDVIPENKKCLPKGHYISSHSLRKAGASTLAALGCSVTGTIMPWGRWDSLASCERYITKNFSVTKFSAGMFDWLLPPGASLQWFSDIQ